jgi:bacillolysin
VQNRASIGLRLAAMAWLSLWAATANAQGRPTTLTATRAGGDLRGADQMIDDMVRNRTLVVRDVQRDTMLPDRILERLDQYARGVRVVGGDLTRQTAPDGTVSVFGTLHADLRLDLTPKLSSEEARAAMARAAGGEPSGPMPELVVLPLPDGYHLAYFGQAFTGVELMNIYVDAASGALLQQCSDFNKEVGHGRGTYGDDKKVSARSISGTFVTDDPLRPAAITTYDMKGNLPRTLDLLNRVFTVAASDVATDSDNDWTDGTIVDAHVYAGWYYDFLAKRFGRSGLDNRNLRMPLLTHPVRLQDIRTASPDVLGTYYLNAFFCRTCLTDGRGAMVFGEGAPRGTYYPTIDVKPFSAALDVVAHELTHGVTANTANLNGFAFSEAGALNEAFSDMIGISTAFYYQPSGNAPLQASYLVLKDITVPSGVFSRSMSNPVSTGDPDHYSARFAGSEVHSTGIIAGHAFYLAIEGGTNRTSGRGVQGVGAANREQIEKSFFRALTALMPSSSTFGLTRVATIQAARDLYGAGSPAERAITQAWDAVGVQERTVPTAALSPNPASPTTTTCTGSATPHWLLGATVSAGNGSIRLDGWSFDFFDHRGALQEHEVLSAANFAQAFTQCGAGSASLMAQTDACTTFCVDLRGDTTGAAQITFTATDDAGRAIEFRTPRTTLLPK